MTIQNYYLILAVIAVVGGYFQEKRGKSTIGLISGLAMIALMIVCIQEKYWLGILWCFLVWLGAVIAGAVIYNVTHGTAGMNRDQITVENVIKHNASENLWREYLTDKKMKTYGSIDLLQEHYIQELAIEKKQREA